MKAAATVLGNLLMAVVVGALGFLFVAPGLLGFRCVASYSSSMEPAIPAGSVLVVQAVPAIGVRAGDIITFTMERGDMVTRRVIEVCQPGGTLSFRTGGDAIGRPDAALVSAASVIGPVRFHVPFLAYLASFVTTWPGFLLTLVMPVVLLLAIGAVRIIAWANTTPEVG